MGEGEHESGSAWADDDFESDFGTLADSDSDTAGERLGMVALSPAAPRKSAAATTAAATRRICAMCGKSLNALTKRQGSRYCSQNCKSKARYQRKKAGLHNDVD